MKRVGIFVHPSWDAARKLAAQLRSALAGKVAEVWETSAWDEKATKERTEGTDLLICLGGDGTMLWAARVVIPHAIPILGVNMGRLGFLAEVRPQELLEKLPEVLRGDGRIEERTMLQAQVAAWDLTLHALNDVVVGRAAAGRPVYVDVAVDGTGLAHYRCDAVIVASATGSTAYALSAGGPILHPESREIVLTTVASHLSTAPTLVLPSDATIELSVGADSEAVVSIDGQIDRTLASTEVVAVRRSPHVARFLRLSPASDYYARLSERLDLRRVVNASHHPVRLGESTGSAPK